MSLEREVKLPVSPAYQVPPLEDVVEGARVVDRGETEMRTVYYDAPDLRLIRAGASLRFREGSGWTVKLPTPERDGLLVREEVEFPDEGAIVPASALGLLRALLRTSDVVPVLLLHTHRHRWEIRDGSDVALANVEDDRVEILSGPRAPVRFREVEIERRSDDGGHVVDAIIGRLRAAGAGAPDPTPKPARALGPLAQAPPDVVAQELPPIPSGADVIRRAIASSVARLIAHDPVIRLDEDPEGVHQARVATRRLRSDLRTFGPLLDPTWSRPLRAELKWLAGALGSARDADVLLDRIRARDASLSVTERPSAAEIVGTLERLDKDAHATLMAALESPRYAALLDALVHAANAPTLVARASRPAAEVLPPLVRKPWKKLVAAARAAGPEPSDEVLHRIRIDAKRVRYAAEAVAVVAGRPAQRLAATAENLQDRLGEHHDAVVAAGWLRAWAVGRSADAAFAAGVLAGREEAAADAAKAGWRRARNALGRRGSRNPM